MLLSPVMQSSNSRTIHSEPSLTSFSSTFSAVSTSSSASTSPCMSSSRIRVPDPIVTISPASPVIVRSLVDQQPMSMSCLVRVQVPRLESKIYTPRKAHRHNPGFGRDKSSSIHGIRSLDAAKANLISRLDRSSFDNNLDISSFGKLYKCGVVGVTYSGSWQMLHCYLFSNTLLCLKEVPLELGSDLNVSPLSTPTAPGKSLKSPSQLIPHSLAPRIKVTLSEELCSVMSVSQEPFSLLLNLNGNLFPFVTLIFEQESERDQWKMMLEKRVRRPKSVAPHLINEKQIVPTVSQFREKSWIPMHISVDIVIIIPHASLRCTDPESTSAINRSIKFLLETFEETDRLGVVTFSDHRALSLTGSELKPPTWKGWGRVFAVIEEDKVKPLKVNSGRQDHFIISGGDRVIQGVNRALQILVSSSQRNPISRIFLLDSLSPTKNDNFDFDRHLDAVFQTVKQAQDVQGTSIYSFGIGTKHDPADLIRVSSATNGMYTYLHDWSQVPRALVGCCGVCLAMSHQDVRLTLRIPDNARGMILRIEGANWDIISANGREASVRLGDFAFGEWRDVIVQLSVPPEPESPSKELWDRLVSDVMSLGNVARKNSSNSFGGTESGIAPRKSNEGSDYEEPKTPLSQQRFLGSDTQLRANTMVETAVLTAGVSTIHFDSSMRRHRVKHEDTLNITLISASETQFSSPTGVDNQRHQSSRKNSNSSVSSLTNLSSPNSPERLFLVPPQYTNNTQLSQRRLELLTARCLERSAELIIGDEPESAAAILRRTLRIIQGLSRGQLPSTPPRSNSTEYFETSPSKRTPRSPAKLEDSSQINGVDRSVAYVLGQELERVLECVHDKKLFSADVRKRVSMVVDILMKQKACTLNTEVESLYSSRIDIVGLLVGLI
ncbi:uncharacterized protein V1516DRAFT_678999, partial [Lipomyces oligophaga]|uniref:uncharacterized protein n=1 Tax=Lipomyces oligophaga TaxID=45792 RepID=UPI0034CFF579